MGETCSTYVEMENLYMILDDDKNERTISYLESDFDRRIVIK